MSTNYAHLWFMLHMRVALELKETVDVIRQAKSTLQRSVRIRAQKPLQVKTKDVISGTTAAVFDHSICLNYDNDNTARPFIRLIRSCTQVETQVSWLMA